MENSDKVIVIVDFDNFFPRHVDEYIGNDGEFSKSFQHVINTLISTYNNISKIDFRLYGGWYLEDNLSNRCSEVMKQLDYFNDFFPVIDNRRKIDGSFELVFHQNNIPHDWKNTFMERNGLSKKLRIDESKMSDKCSINKQSCPIHILKTFTNSKKHSCSISGCTTIHEEVFKLREQKMVDTMMACDVASFTIDHRNYVIIAIMSDDVDIFPSMALRHHICNTAETILFVKNKQNAEKYNSIINQFNVQIKLIPNE